MARVFRRGLLLDDDDIRLSRDAFLRLWLIACSIRLRR
jgi:hypothetical protein